VITGIGTAALSAPEQLVGKLIGPRIGAIRPANAADNYIESAKLATGLASVPRQA